MCAGHDCDTTSADSSPFLSQGHQGSTRASLQVPSALRATRVLKHSLAAETRYIGHGTAVTSDQLLIVRFLRAQVQYKMSLVILLQRIRGYFGTKSPAGEQRRSPSCTRPLRSQVCGDKGDLLFFWLWVCGRLCRCLLHGRFDERTQ